MLRSYLGHLALEVLFSADELDKEGAVVFGEPHPLSEGDVLPVEVKSSAGLRYTGLHYYQEAVKEASEMAAKHQLDESDARAGVLLYRTGSELEADLVITGRGWLLAERGRLHGRPLASVVSPEEALALMGLYLRCHYQPVVVGGAPVRWAPASMRRSAAFVAMPAFERWNQAGRVWCDTDGDLTLESLNKTCLTRVSRAFKFRDNIFGLSATMVGHEPEEMLCELDSLLFSLVGAFDVAARIVDRLLGLHTKGVYGWQNAKKNAMKPGWQTRLQTPAKALHDYSEDGSEMQWMFQVLRWLRNTVHNEALDLLRDDRAWVVTVPAAAQVDLRAFLRVGLPGWTAETMGIRALPTPSATAAKWLPGTGRYSVALRRAGAPRSADPLEGQLVLDVRRFINKSAGKLSAISAAASASPPATIRMGSRHEA